MLNYLPEGTCRLWFSSHLSVAGQLWAPLAWTWIMLPQVGKTWNDKYRQLRLLRSFTRGSGSFPGIPEIMDEKNKISLMNGSPVGRTWANRCRFRPAAAATWHRTWWIWTRSRWTIDLLDLVCLNIGSREIPRFTVYRVITFLFQIFKSAT